MNRPVNAGFNHFYDSVLRGEDPDETEQDRIDSTELAFYSGVMWVLGYLNDLSKLPSNTDGLEIMKADIEQFCLRARENAGMTTEAPFMRPRGDIN